MHTFIIAEAGVNHNGQDDLALALVDAAAEAGADAVKFQTFSAEKVVQKGASKAEYQKAATGGGSQFDMLKKLEMSVDLHHLLLQRCAEHGIELMSTPFDNDAADFLVGLGMRRMKISSGEITNLVFLRHLAAKGVPIILSTGMATLDEIAEAVDCLRAHWAGSGDIAENLTILHCTSNYPTAPQDVHLNAMRTIAEVTGLPVGYSDHTVGIAVCTAAAALGARVIEKHFTLDRTMPGPDHKASLEPGELKAMVEQVRVVEAALGSAAKGPTASEREMRVLARRSVSAASDLAPGTVLSARDLVMLRPATGIAPRDHDALLGRVLKRPLAAGQALQWDDLEQV
ncbi:N-acetylneuraminate synthase [Meridianimarinicoccus roseus]|uniref:N-acetylneuraminate synthase n=1 Tax=Meridianimarinicoccus roseus TaxID=2072018 RepID=A0A2V2LI01_9RHOB|nr:N-acetylneuraminate synthase [Meridianimarinicoccus roseus]PWR04552.1 N-acetylneuraminate synthase [Meridianimarinicoccus roseus]